MDKRGKVHEIAVTLYGWKLIVFALGCYGIFPMTEYSILSGGKLKDARPDIGTYQEILAKIGLIAHG